MTPSLVTFKYDLKLFRCCNMPSRKEVERKILKINKEISNLKWQIKNKVLTDRQREVKRNKIRELKATRKDLTKQVEGWRVEGSASLLPETIGNRYVRNTEQVSHSPRWKMGKRFQQTASLPVICMPLYAGEWKARGPCQSI